MTDNDPAFLWETEALRSGAQRAAEAELDDAAAESRSGSDQPASDNWVTLRAASQSTGIPVETLRKWARRATIPTYLTPTAAGTNIRMVDLDGITARAADLGRPLHPPPTKPAPPPITQPTAPVPEGTMIVPVDAWNKMLNQLGNLHEAGQHLAEARERAAKAETEAKFLRERLAELREDPVPPALQLPDIDPVAVADVAAEPPEKVWHYLIRRVRDRG